MSDQFDKPSRSEDEYFHRRDRELLEQKRRAEAEVTARQALASALGLTTDDLMQRLQAQFPDGTTFVVQAPDSFTQEQVLQLAETVTYTP